MMGTRRSRSPHVWLSAGLLALAACAPERGTQTDPAQPAAAPPAAAASDTVPAEAPALAPLTSEGWGPLRIGMTLAEVTAAAGPDSDPEAVGGPDPESCDIFHPAGAPEGLDVMIEDGRLARISLSAPTEVRTERGFGPGATAAAVKAAYDEALRASPHEYEEAPAEYLTFWARGGGDQPHVRSEGARGMRYEVDASGTVAAIHAGGTAIQYVEGCL